MSMNEGALSASRRGICGTPHYRTGNPTLAAFEVKVAALDGGPRAVSVACGMAAVGQTLPTLLSAGSRPVCHHTIYHWSRELLHRELPQFGVEVVTGRHARERGKRLQLVGESHLASGRLSAMPPPGVRA